ncbi:MAG TPA: efflux RND transporter periplasmic adaptor subunit [Candidatus Acidoferrales bacterium]|nr:efflux RND transporter periplasmic adaptor subunit [Candidatus Acidoferrales bacterium]
MNLDLNEGKICCPRKLRSDLTLRQQQAAGGTFFVIKDPISDEFFRLGEVEHFIARQFDGETPLETIRQRTEARFGAALSVNTLNAFLQKLSKNHLLESDEGKNQEQAPRKRRFGGSALYLRFKLFDPAQLLNRLAPRTRFFFTPYFLVLSATAILIATGVTIANWGEFVHGLTRLYTLSTIPLVLAIVLLVGVPHEFGHALTCTHFGGEVHEMGFAFIYFEPAFYCNVSDAWLFTEKSKRLWVSFAGPYFETFIWALATLAWRWTEADTWINTIGLIVMATSGLQVLFNFNPLIKLDGYYILSDYLEIPNLRKKSFQYVGRVIERMFGAVPPMAQEVPLRERTIYLLYGLIALIGSFSILGCVFLAAGRRLLEGRAPLTAALTLGLLGVSFRTRLRALFGKPSGATAPTVVDAALVTSETASSPVSSMNLAKAEETHVAPLFGAAPFSVSIMNSAGAEGTQFNRGPDTNFNNPPKKKKKGPWKRRIIWTAVAGAALGVLLFGHAGLQITGPFHVLPIDNSDVRPAVEGIIKAIYVHEGDHVKKGDLIALLDDKDLLAELHKTEAQIAQASANLKKLLAGPTEDEIKVASANVTKAEDSLKYAQMHLAMMKLGFDEDIISRKAYEEAAALESSARNDLAVTRAQLQLLLSGSRPEDIEATRAQIKALETQRSVLENQLLLLTIVSPSTGIVATPSVQLREMTHQLVKKGDLVAKVYDLDTVTVEIPVPEKEIADVRIGQSVVLRARAYPDQAFYGTVTFIATSAQGGPSEQTPGGTISSSTPVGENRTVLVLTQIDNHSLLLKPEMTGQAKIIGGTNRIPYLIARRMARTLKVDFWSWW